MRGLCALFLKHDLRIRSCLMVTSTHARETDKVTENEARDLGNRPGMDESVLQWLRNFCAGSSLLP